MKKILAITAALLMAGTADAQYGQQRPARRDYYGVRFGVFVAPNISWMHPTAAQDDNGEYATRSNGSKAGFIYGLMADYFFAENYGIATGIQVSSTGGSISVARKIPANGQPVTADFSYRLQYLEIPFALKLRTDDIQGFRFFGQLGATLGFNISKKATYNVDYLDASGNTQSVGSDESIKLPGSLGVVAPVMLQMNLGAGLEYPISNKMAVYAGVFFNNGFLPDATKPNLIDEQRLGYQGEFRDANTRLNNFALRIGLFF